MLYKIWLAREKCWANQISCQIIFTFDVIVSKVYSIHQFKSDFHAYLGAYVSNKLQFLIGMKFRSLVAVTWVNKGLNKSYRYRNDRISLVCFQDDYTCTRGVLKIGFYETYTPSFNTLKCFTLNEIIFTWIFTSFIIEFLESLCVMFEFSIRALVVNLTLCKWWPQRNAFKHYATVHPVPMFGRWHFVYIL